MKRHEEHRLLIHQGETMGSRIWRYFSFPQVLEDSVSFHFINDASAALLQMQHVDVFNNG
jgi:hypothetical protein